MIRLPRFLFAALLTPSLLHGCGADSPSPGCDQPDLDDAEVLGFELISLNQGVFRDSDGVQHQAWVRLAVNYRTPEESPGSFLSLDFSLFPSAQALSCVPPGLGTEVVSVGLYSDSDFNQNYREGDNLAELLIRRPEDLKGTLRSEGFSFDIVGPLPTLARAHSLTLEVTLDSGVSHRVALGSIIYPERLPSDADIVEDIPSAPASAGGRLNDTGQTFCTQAEGTQRDCPVSGYPLQDGDLGRDSLARDGELDKTGAGSAGFDFTKLDPQGEPLPESAEKWTCVRDNHTGRIWEVKADSGLRDGQNTYSWYRPDDSGNGGDPGRADGGECSGSACDTRAYVKALNTASLCGRSDWRLPRRAALASLAHYGEFEPRIDPSFFPRTESDWYWTASPFLGDYGGAWTVNFPNGRATASRFSENLPVRLVSGDPATEQAGESAHCAVNNLSATLRESDFEALESGAVVRDQRTALEWRRCTLGQSWDGAGCSGEPGVFTWQQALNRVADYPGWRLPNIKELNSLVELCRVAPATHPDAFPDTPYPPYSLGGNSGLAFWTGTTVPGREGQAFSVEFRTGAYRTDTKFSNLGDLGFVRLVRDEDASPE